MIVNPASELAYENLGLIINEFEKAALLHGGREGALIVASNPLSGMDNMLASSDNVLGQVQNSRVKSAQGGADTSNSKDIQSLANGLVPEFDADIEELLGGGENAQKIGDYLKDCLNCNLRLQFDWQLKPLNLLGGIEGMIDGIKDILDAFELQLDPFKSLEGLCDLLNMVKGLCIQDLIIVMLSLKLLLKKYISDAINIQLDWTVLLGPLLNMLVEGIASLLEQLMGLILAPLDCTLNALYTANELEREARELAAQIGTFANASVSQAKSLTKGNLPADTNLDGIAEDYRWTDNNLGETQYPDAPVFGSLVASERKTGGGEVSFGVGKNAANGADLTLPTGFHLTRGTTLNDALKDINFANSTITEKLIIPVQDAKRFLQDLLGNIMKSLRSVQLLVSGGLSVQMGNIGIIMFLRDMISLVMMIIKMLTQNPNVSDWCKELEQHPEILEQQLNRFGSAARDIKVENGDDSTLLLRRGPETVMQISTCASSRSTQQSQLIDQWIRDLKRKGVN